MVRFDPWPWHRRRPPQPSPEPMPALPFLDQQVAEFEDMPMGGNSGEAFVVPPDPPATAASGGLVIEPPDWEAEASSFPSEGKEAGPQVDALTAMKMAAGDMDWPEWGPLASSAPLEPVTFPEVDDWRAVEREQAHLKGKP